jgi:TPR repeat protein
MARLNSVHLVMALGAAALLALPAAGAPSPQPQIAAPKGCGWRTNAGGRGYTLFCREASGSCSAQMNPRLSEHTLADALAGEPKAMTNVGLFYLLYAPKNLRDSRVAMSWFRKAANKGNPTAMTLLASLYEGQEGIPVDEAQAVKWFLEAALAGEPMAMFEIGVRYERGEGLPKDLALSRQWHLKAAERGQVVSMAVVANMMREGRGGPKDPAGAAQWQRRHDAAIRAYDPAWRPSPSDAGPAELASPAQANAAADRAAKDAERAADDAEAITEAQPRRTSPDACGPA